MIDCETVVEDLNSKIDGYMENLQGSHAVYRVRAVPPQQYEIQKLQPSGDWRGISWSSNPRAIAAVLIRKNMVESAETIHTLEQFTRAYEAAADRVVAQIVETVEL